MKAQNRTHRFFQAIIAILISGGATGVALGQQVLFPDLLNSNPSDAQVNVLRERGRKGLLFHFKFQDGANLDSNVGFPLNMATATVTLQIGANAPLTCSAGSNPVANACGFTVVDGPDADGALDTVRVLFNGDLAASTAIKYSVSGARSTPIPAVVQNADPNVVTFTTGNAAPRDPASIELVFDISGSMALPAVASGPVSRIDAVKSASQVFFSMLDDYAWLNDKIGVVYFSTNATVFDPTPGGSNLELAQDSAKVTLIAQNIQAQVPTNLTSIGAGLQSANTAGFALDPGAVRKKSVVLFSDGEQNTAPNVAVAGSNVQINGANYPVDNVCPITAGVMTAPGFLLQQDIANARCGNLNAHILQNQQTFAQADLETHFAQLFQNFLIGDKLESVRDVTGKIAKGATAQHKFVASSNDVALSILLSWSAPKVNNEETREILPFRLIAPNGTEVDISHRTKVGRNMLFTTAHFPLSQNGAAVPVKGEWTIELVATQIRSPQLDFHLLVMLDNPGIATDFRVEGRDFGTGEAIPIRVQITEGGAPVLNATVSAELLGPDNGVGNILSREATPSGSPNPAGDALRSAAQGKLLLLLNDPTKAGLFSSSGLPVVNLLDNGQAANGDATTSDGIYSALFTNNQKEGHYRFVITVRGTTAAGADFQRTHTLTVFVRPKPSAANTIFTLLSSITQPDGSVIIRLNATPHDAFNNFLGPDYLGSLRILSSEGTVGQVEDKLNGSYEVTIHLPSANSNPSLTLEVLGATVTTTTLAQLKSSFPPWLLWLLILLALILIIIIIWWLLRRKKKTP